MGKRIRACKKVPMTQKLISECKEFNKGLSTRLRKSLEQFRNRVQLEDHIQFLDDYDLIGELMGHLDIYWRLGGHRGNSSIPIIEAMRRAIPVIADASVNHR